MDTALELRGALDRYFAEWSTMDGPWWESDLVLGLYRHLEPGLQGAQVTIPEANRRDLIWFLSDDGDWASVTAPRVAAENWIRSSGPLLRADLCCRSENGVAYDWLLEAKIWSETHANRSRGVWSLDSRMLGGMLKDLQKWQSVAEVGTGLFLVGAYSQSPACNRGGSHCKSIEDLVDDCKGWLAKFKGDPLESLAEWHVWIKQRVTSGIRGARIVGRWTGQQFEVTTTNF